MRVERVWSACAVCTAVAIVSLCAGDAQGAPLAGCQASTGVFYSEQEYSGVLGDWVDVERGPTDHDTGLMSAEAECGDYEHHYLAKAQAIAPFGVNPEPTVRSYLTASDPTDGPSDVCYSQAMAVLRWQPDSATLPSGTPITVVFDISIEGAIYSGGMGLTRSPETRVALTLNAYDCETDARLSGLQGGARIASLFDEVAEEYFVLFEDSGCLDDQFTWPGPGMWNPAEPSIYAAGVDTTVPLTFAGVVGGEYIIEVILRSEIADEGSLSETTSRSEFFNTCSYEFRAAYDPADTLMQTQLDVSMTATPEPATLSLLGLGGLALTRRRRIG